MVWIPNNFRICKPIMLAETEFQNLLIENRFSDFCSILEQTDLTDTERSVMKEIFKEFWDPRSVFPINYTIDNIASCLVEGPFIDDEIDELNDIWFVGVLRSSVTEATKNEFRTDFNEIMKRKTTDLKYGF